MSKRAGSKLNNVGLPADRRTDSSRASLGSAPSADVPIAGSGYEKKWTKPNAQLPDAGKTSKSKGNGSW